LNKPSGGARKKIEVLKDIDDAEKGTELAGVVGSD